METEPLLPQTKYHHLAAILRERLRSHPNGDKLPSVRALMKRFQVGQHTVTSALRMLEKEELIVRRVGSGVYRNDSSRPVTISFCRPDNASTDLENREHALRAACQHRDWKLAVYRFDPKLMGIFDDDIHTDGFIVQPEMLTFHSPLLKRLSNSRTPSVVMGRDTGNIHLDFCTGDNDAILNEFVKGLVERGHRRLALLVSEPHFHEVKESMATFTQLCRLLNLEYVEILDARVQYGPDSLPQSAAYLRTFLQGLSPKKLPFSALITCSSPGSIAALRTLYDAGFQAPRDYSLCCMGTDVNAPYSIPSITNATPHVKELAEACLRIIDQRLHNDQTPLLYERVVYRACWRESAGPVPKGKANRARLRRRGAAAGNRRKDKGRMH